MQSLFAKKAYLFILASFTASAIAQESNQSIEEIIVEGILSPATSVTRSTTPVMDLPQSIHVIDRSLLDNQIAFDISEVVRNVSGIQGKPTYDHMGQGLSGDYLIRGLWSESYVNGRQTFINAGLDPASLINVERVEIVKGGASTLFAGGYGAPNGGTINLVEKLPTPESGTELGLYGGSFGTFGATLDLNVPLSEIWGFRLTGEASDRDINIDDITNEIRSIYPTLRGDYGDTQVVLRGRYQALEYDYYHGLDGSFEAITDASGVVVGSTVAPYRNIASGRIPTGESDAWGLDAEVQHQFSANLSGSIRLGSNKAEDLNHYVFFVTDTGSLGQDIDMWDISADLTYHTDLGGIDSSTVLLLDHTDTEVDFLDTYNSASFGTFITPINGEYLTSNLGVQQEFGFNDRVRILLGATYSQMELNYTASGTPRNGLDESEVNWKAGISFDLTDNISPFVSYSDGNRLPTPTVVSSAFFVGEPELEGTQQIELGIKYQFPGSGVIGTLVAFDNDLENAAESIGFTPLQLNETSKGIDFDLQWQINDRTSLAMNYTSLDAEVDEAGSIYNGNTPFNLPENFGRIAGRFSLSENWGLGAGVSWGDERAGGLNNAYFLEDYVLVDLQVDYKSDAYEIRVGVDNLFDADHFEPVMFFGGGYFDQTQPRTFTVQAKARF